jgi:hypothetical protein
MHARELIDLAAVVAVHTPVLLRAARDIPEESVEAYWVASKCRLDRWGRALKKLTASNSSGAVTPNSAEHRAFRGILEEILAGEVLTRVWSAAMCAYDRARGTDRMEPVARSVLIGQIEARHRVLTILVGRCGLTAEEAMRLDALRRRTERWTDLLIGYLAAGHDVREFAADPDRAGDFADDFVQQRRQEGGRFVWPMVLASLRAAFHEWLEPVSPNPDLNAKIAASILVCFPPEVFDGAGMMQSEWLLRISHITSEAEGMLEELLAEIPSPTGNQAGTTSRERFDRWDRFNA